MLIAHCSHAETNAIKAEIKRLEQAHAECQDSGIQKKIEAWITQRKRNYCRAENRSNAM